MAAQKDSMKSDMMIDWFIFSANVPDDQSPLASGAQPAQAGCVTEVPEAWGFGPSARWAFHFLHKLNIFHFNFETPLRSNYEKKNFGSRCCEYQKIEEVRHT